MITTTKTTTAAIIIQAEKIKYENIAQEIKNIWKLNNVSIYPSSSSQ